MTSEAEWTRKYKRALLERNPALQTRRIQEAKAAMAARKCAIDGQSRERQVIDRAMDILGTLRELHVTGHS